METNGKQGRDQPPDDRRFEEAALKDGIVFFDGECNLCNNVVDFILRYDRKHRIRFASLQSPRAQAFFAGSDINPQSSGTLVFVRDGQLLVQSEAVLEICRELRAPWRWLRFFSVLPRRLRDALYRFIAARRYKWFGQRASCRQPSPAEKDRFLG